MSELKAVYLSEENHWAVTKKEIDLGKCHIILAFDEYTVCLDTWGRGSAVTFTKKHLGE